MPINDEVPPSIQIAIAVILIVFIVVVVSIFSHHQEAKIKNTISPTKDVVSKVMYRPHVPVITVGESKYQEEAKLASRDTIAMEIDRTNKNIENIEIQEKIIKKFGEHGMEAIAVAQAESGLNPSAVNVSSNCIGLFQIMVLDGRPSAQELLDIDTNIDTAYKIYTEQGWCPWEVSEKLLLCNK
ncbi:MAG: hypothetical protein BWY74_00330 [Firmicutes bacterium ADurb.Bin419]|nr:MAG: hypothetical protein BWY74_00330 [Firmicutes bacterium ADurb.Bin419]